ncbi:MAG: discoidin domain-containing protein [Anaerolineales bacterium]|nr:discoidin domain-containing protein [Anaerolineales bacterium]MBX3037876.1 discoidin domain-containing protein [Anaerolineales bacterium]
MKRLSFVLVLTMLISSCNLPQTVTATAVNSPTLTSTSVIKVVTPSLNQIPLIWFAPLPPLPVVEGRPYTGSDDYIKLFETDAPWQTAASRIQVLKLYGEWVGYASQVQLEFVIQNAQQRGFALAMEFGPLDAEDCGEGIEGFSGVSYAVDAAKRIKAAGGTLHFIAMDEPFYYGHFYDGPNACRWSAEKIAREINQFSKAMKAVFPDILIGDTEALAGQAGANQYKEWVKIFREVNGYDLAFLHIDVDWSRPNWAQEIITIEEYADVFDVPVGIIYTGNGFDSTDEEWLSAAGERVKKLEIEHHANPDHILFQSWNDKPDRTLPESKDFTFTNFINDYFEDKAELGYKREGEGANLALGKNTRVSNFIDGLTGSFAVDGDLGTLWNSGGGPTQWIEIDLGKEYNILKIELTISQYPAGKTTHRIFGGNASRQYVELAVFSGNTSDGQVLIFLPDKPSTAIQFIRVETVESPSWIAWREIEVFDAGN